MLLLVSCPLAILQIFLQKVCVSIIVQTRNVSFILSQKAGPTRRKVAGELKTSLAHFDEMESFEHTKLKPLSIALAVRARTGEIIGAQPAEMMRKFNR